MRGREPVDHLLAGPPLEPRRRRRGVHTAREDELIHTGPDVGRGALYSGLSSGAVPIDSKARHRAQARGNRGMAGNDSAAVEALTQDHVVELRASDISYGRADDVLRQLVGVGVSQRALHGGADGRTQGGHNDGVRHGCLRFV